MKRIIPAALIFILILGVMGCETPQTETGMNDVTKENVSDAVKYYDFAKEYLKNKQYDSAIKNFEKAIADSSKFKDAYIGLGEAYESKMYYTKAEETYEKLMEEMPSHPAAYTALGSLYTKLREYDKAEQYFDAALDKDPGFANAWYGKGKLLEAKYSGSEGILKALSCYEKACAIDSENLSLAYKYGKALIESGRYKEAQAFLKKVVESHPKIVGPLTNLAEAYLESGDYEEAAAAFRKTIQLDPTIVNSYLGLARSYQGMGEWTKAKNAYLRLAEENPNSVIPYLYLGQMYLNLKNYDQAIFYLKKGHDVSPSDTRTLLLLGQAYFFKGNPKDVKTEDDRENAYKNLEISEGYFKQIIELGRNYVGEAEKGLKNISNWRKELDPTRW
ncbi:MAG: tetratricopeptide repeat protein [candidate division WOR-3 bacterium]|nr:tetratricopeptide repeat protein [candidate division WOR-3 bacterium]